MSKIVAVTLVLIVRKTVGIPFELPGNALAFPRTLFDDRAFAFIPGIIDYFYRRAVVVQKTVAVAATLNPTMPLSGCPSDAC